MNIIEQLLNLQKTDIEIRHIEKEIKDIPARKEYESKRLKEFKTRVDDSQKAVKAGEASIKQVELEVKSVNEKIQKLRQQQMELKSNKEFKAMESEIDSLKSEISTLEDKQLGVMEEIDASRKILSTETASLQQQETILGRDIKSLDEKLEQLRTKLVVLQGEREKVAVDVSPQFLSAYERIFSHKDVAVVSTENGICGGCHMQLPPALVHDARKHTNLVACNYCGRLLY